MKKNGKRNGKQRWRCTGCDASTTIQRPDTKARNELTAFVNWLASKQTQAEFGGGTGRTFRHHTAWCWNITPHLNPTGELFDEIQVDGIYLRPGWCCLIAIANHHVIAWQWCNYEKAAAWNALLNCLPEPKVVVTDGGSGLYKCVTQLWPQARIQRCLVHVQRTVRQHLTLRPKTPAGKALRLLSLKLTRIRTTQQAAEWTGLLNDWHTEYQHLLTERTYAKQHTGPRPAGIRSTRVWWYTHERLRKEYSAMNRPLSKGHLFAFLDTDLRQLPINTTTNMIEGAINSGIRAMLHTHRGMSTEHRRRAVEWFCWSHADPAARPGLHEFVTAELYARQRLQQPVQDPDDGIGGPQLYGDAAVAEEGLWSRAGWGGRTASTHC